MRRWLIVSLAIVAAAAVAAYGFKGLSSETPEKAIYALAHDLEHGDIEGVCERIVASAGLPPDAARALDSGGRQGTSRDAGCRLDRDMLEHIDLHEPRVLRVDEHPMRPQGGFDAVATAEVRTGSRTWSLPLVRHDGRWRVVLDAARPPLTAETRD